jgi:2-polyprenyl-3-methyl-5-hydroxy-6-metoxy-1,4-benzoquinol methylase
MGKFFSNYDIMTIMKTAVSQMSQSEQQYWSIHEFRYRFLQQQISALNLPQGAKILDVGCYPPFLYNWLVEQGFDVYGVASAHEQVFNKKIEVLNIEQDTFPWENNTFDVVIFTEVLEHLPHSPIFPLEEMHHVLKSGGQLIITTPNAAKLHHRLKLLTGKSTSFPIDQLMEVEPGNGSIYHLHNREYTLSEVERLIEKAGFKVKKGEQVCLYPPTRKKTQAESVMSKTVKWLGYTAQQAYAPFRDSLLVIGQKN